MPHPCDAADGNALSGPVQVGGGALLRSAMRVRRTENPSPPRESGSRPDLGAPVSRGSEWRTFLSMALDDERCCFCRRAVAPREWSTRPGWLEIECPVCGLYRVERLFWMTAHFKKARRPVLYRRLARWLEESRNRAEPPEIPFDGWENVASGA